MFKDKLKCTDELNT